MRHGFVLPPDKATYSNLLGFHYQKHLIDEELHALMVELYECRMAEGDDSKLKEKVFLKLETIARINEEYQRSFRRHILSIVTEDRNFRV